MRTRHRHITFQPDGTEAQQALLLELESPWRMSCGIEPNLNSARVSYVEYAKLGDDPAKTGSICFYFNGEAPASFTYSPSLPDAKIEKISIVDVEPLRAGYDKQNVWRWLEYRLVFADRRHLWKAPRGGMLNLGLVNLDAAAPTMTTAQLVAKCLEAMGETQLTLPEALTASVAPSNLDWNGAHSPTELARLLELAPVVLTLKANGGIAIERMGEGASVTIPAEQMIRRMPWTGIERVGRAVVFVGDTILNQETHDYDPANALGLHWVKREPTTLVAGQGPGWRWTKLDVADATLALNNDWAGREGQAYIQQYQYDAFRAVAVFGVSGAVLRAAVSNGVMSRGRPELWAKCAMKHADGVWRNSDEWQVIPVTAIEEQSLDPTVGPAIIHLPVRLFRVVTPSENLIGNVVALAAGEMRLMATREVLDANGAPKPTLFGFKQELGQIVQLTDDQTALAMKDPTTLLVPAPGWRLLQDEGQYVNLYELNKRARELNPERYIGGSGRTQATTWAAGFVVGDLSGVVSDIEIDQRAVQTTIHENRWFVPHGRYLVKGKGGRGGSGGSGGAMQSKLQLAATGARDAVIAVSTGPVADMTGGGQETIWALIGEQSQTNPLCYAWREVRANSGQTDLGWFQTGKTGTSDANPAVDYISKNQELLTGRIVLMRRVLRPTNDQATTFADEWAIVPQPLSGAGGGATSQWFWIDIPYKGFGEPYIQAHVNDDDWRGKPLTVRAWYANNGVGTTPADAMAMAWNRATVDDASSLTEKMLMFGEDYESYVGNYIGSSGLAHCANISFSGVGSLYLAMEYQTGKLIMEVRGSFVRLQCALQIEAGEVLDGPTHQLVW